MANPTLWNVPYKQNQYFTGREDILKQLHQTLRTVNTVGLTHAQGISGLGGIGKTQTAIEFAYRYGTDYDAVFWARADSITALFASFVDIARLLQLSERREQDQRIIVEAVLRWLRLHTRWLLIFDNMDDLALAEPFLPLASQGHVLFTTRARAFVNLAQRVDILQMEPETGALLLLRRAELISLQATLNKVVIKDRDLACNISRELDGLPLALDQAGAYIKETPSTLAQYFLLYQQRREDLLKLRGANSQDYPAPVATTWSLSFEKVTQANPAATDLLTLCAFLAPDAIPETIFTRGAPYLGHPLGPVAAHEHQFNLACREALRYSLIARAGDAETLTMHRLVQTVLRENTPVKKQDNWRLMPTSFSKHKTIATRQEWKQRAVLAVSAASPKVQDTDAWPDCEVWVPHALVCANWIEQEKFFYQEGTDLLNQAGFYLDARARYTEAETMYRNNLAIYEQLFEPTHPYIGQALGSLGGLYQHQGKYTAAEPLLERSLAIFEQQLGKQHQSTKTRLNNSSKAYNDQKARKENAEFRRWLVVREEDLETALNNLATNYHSLGKHAEAEALYQRAQSINAQQLGTNSSNEAQNLSNLATLYVEQRKYKEAEQLLKRALAMQQQQMKNMHPVTADILNNLGELYAFQGNAKEAEPLLKQALAMREKVLGSRHPDTAISLDNLAVLYYEQGNYQETEHLWQKALAIWKQHNHPDVAKSLNNLAELYKAQKRYEEAEPLLEQAVTVCEQLLGVNHPDTAAPLSNLALLYMELEKYKEGEPLLKRALAIREKALGPNHPGTAITRKNLETFYRNWQFIQQRQKAEVPGNKEIESNPPPTKSQRNSEQQNDTSTIASLNAQAKQAESQSRYAEAERLYRRALEQQERQLGGSHLDIATSLDQLIQCYLAQRKYKEAEPLARRALNIRQQRSGLNNPEAVYSLQTMGNIYLALQKYKEATPIITRAFMLSQTVFGPNHPVTQAMRKDFQL